MADGIDHARDAAKAVQAPARNVGHMGDAPERHQMVRADTVDRDAADHDHVGAGIRKAIPQRSGGIQVIAAEQALLPEFPNPLGRASHVGHVGCDAAGRQQIGHRGLKGDGIEGLAARDADADGAAGWRVVIVAMTHVGSLLCPDTVAPV